MNSTTNLPPTPLFTQMVPFNFSPHHQPSPLAASYRFAPYSFPPIYLDKEAPLPSLLEPFHSTAESEGDSSPSSCGLCTPAAAAIPRTYSPASDKEILSSAHLTEKDLWKSFDAVGNEMIVTKPGRRLFPTILVTVSGLVPTVQYSIKVRFVSADKYRHKYITGLWTAVGESDIIHDESKMMFVHPSSPCYGDMWIKKPISFKSIKITHHADSQNGNILLHTMHKYRIEVVISPHDEHFTELVFPLTHSEFIAVTSYQSSAITKLKVDNNPFAKGFRDRETFVSPYTTPHGYSPFLPPYNPFLHPLWATLSSSGSVFPSITNIPSLFSPTTSVPTMVHPTISTPPPPLFSSTSGIPQVYPPITSVPSSIFHPATSIPPSMFPPITASIPGHLSTGIPGHLSTGTPSTLQSLSSTPPSPLSDTECSDCSSRTCSIRDEEEIEEEV